MQYSEKDMFVGITIIISKNKFKVKLLTVTVQKYQWLHKKGTSKV
jgi:hypothetical protein